MTNEKSTGSADVCSGDYEPPTHAHAMAPATKARYSKPQPYLGVLARFPRAIMEIAKVSSYGAMKHQKQMGDMSYLDVPEAEVNYVEAEVRHLLHEAIHGPINDDDAGLIHKAQKAWEALADLEVYLYQEESQMMPELPALSEDEMWAPVEEEDLVDLDRAPPSFSRGF